MATACSPKPDAAIEVKMAELEKKVADYEAAAKLAADNVESLDKLDMEAWNSKDSTALAALHDPAVKAYFNGGTEQGFAAHLAEMSGMFKMPMFPKVTAMPVKVSQGDWTAAVEDYEMPGADGKTVKGSMAVFIKWKDGKVVEEHVMIDLSGLGGPPPPPPAQEKKK
jgi:hypothetical protein